MQDYDDSLGGETTGGNDNSDRFEGSLGDASTMGDANIENDWDGEEMELADLSARYNEEGVLGRGGMGEVLLATDTRLDRKVAIKRILGKAARSKTATQRFFTEAKSIAALNHTNIVQIYDYGRSAEGPFLIMECVQGGSLLDKCKEGPIELDEAVNIFSQLCDALAKAHDANIIHRDIKPANVLMTEDGVPKLTDFGLAKDDSADTGMTMQGAVIGTLDFMSPEQREGAHLTDHRSDLWSLAATFYQMVTGQSPKVIDITECPAALQPVISRSLKRGKEDRYQTALEMKAAFQEALSTGLDLSRDLQQGECPSCGTTNPTDRKFCRNEECAASLEAHCLVCNEEMLLSDNVCGSCGAKQTPLLEEARKRLEKQHQRAEKFLNALDFEKASAAADEVINETHPRLQQYAAWHKDFIVRLSATRWVEHDALGEKLTEAIAHEEAYDYDASLLVLNQVASALQDTLVSSHSDSARSMRDRVSQKQNRLEALDNIVRQRIRDRDLDELLPIVEELLALNPNRENVAKLRGQLIAKKVRRLRNEIADAVNANKLKGLLPLIVNCLEIEADQSDLIKLKDQLELKEAQDEKSLRDSVDSADRHAEEGDKYGREVDYRNAIEGYSKAIEFEPDNYFHYAQRARTFQKLDEYQQAVDSFTQALELNPEDEVSYYGRAVAYAWLGEDYKAIDDYTKAIEIDPDWAISYYGRGLKYRKLAKIQRAIEDFTKAIELDPKYEEAYDKRALCYDEIGETKLAWQDRRTSDELYDKSN